MTSRRLIVLLTLATFAAASCGGADEGAPVPSTSAPAAGGVVPTSTPTTTGQTPAPATTTTVTVEAPSGVGQVEVVFDDGRSWTFDGICVYTPDNTGPASALWRIDAAAVDGSTFIAIMAFPLDPAKTSPVLIGNIVDADENIFVLIESEDVSDGSNLILNLGLHDGVFTTVDDPIDITATATCGL
ncbi:MAG: hypothetical protein OEO77_01565 [Acidimicrobiia bacterium]|nr:hypothetical protein [Acidimicrobiia bacterium]